MSRLTLGEIDTITQAASGHRVNVRLTSSVEKHPDKVAVITSVKNYDGVVHEINGGWELEFPFGSQRFVFRFTQGPKKSECVLLIGLSGEIE